MRQSVLLIGLSERIDSCNSLGSYALPGHVNKERDHDRGQQLVGNAGGQAFRVIGSGQNLIEFPRLYGKVRAQIRGAGCCDGNLNGQVLGDLAGRRHVQVLRAAIG